ncbi:YgiW/YdeI family stress tolerance OB fold protein [Kalamiella sp. sgz302252]|uniref:YgiW/YdeI family stress tolerance OB fold protein n=1 Tax=Pantoea sp. sgz302252 TaxID=3341827 RepID=UPI0036D2AAA8
MKKSAALLAIAALVSAPAFAAQTGGFSDPAAPAAKTQQGGFSGQETVVTVKQAQDMQDDAWVTMRGSIEKRISEDDYIFRDETGTIKVDIDHKRWEGQTVTPKDKVEIQGELDKDFNSVEVDVKKVRKLN